MTPTTIILNDVTVMWSLGNVPLRRRDRARLGVFVRWGWIVAEGRFQVQPSALTDLADAFDT